ncbi:MAG: hypothetical protein P8Y51_02895 [Campylobacterales bacterium]
MKLSPIKTVIAISLIVFIIFFIATCGGGGSGTFARDTETLTFNVMDLSETNEDGTRMESYQIKVLSIDLMQKDQNVTVYSGTAFLESVGEGNGTIAGTLNGQKPTIGIYEGIALTLSDYRIKTKVVIDDTAYYTREENVSEGDAWNLSENESDYGYTTVTRSTPETVKVWFPTPLSVESEFPVELFWALLRSGTVRYEGTGVGEITWVGEDDIINALLPKEPSKWIRFDLKTTDGKFNTLSILLDGEGRVLGGFCYRPETKAINGSWLSDASLNVDNSFTLTFVDGDDASQSIEVNGSYDCINGKYTISSVEPAIENLDTDQQLSGLVCRPE